ncbi:hypothetical protein Q5752_005499 [Cryptotrichosporon argae]
MLASDLEWALIDSSASLPFPASTSSAAAAPLVAAVLGADFKAVLVGPDAPARAVLPPDLDAPVPASDDVTRLAVAVALLHAFVQVNWTGPDLGFTVADVLGGVDAAASSSSSSSSSADLNAAALARLTLLGEPAYHLCAEPALFHLALRLFASLELPSTPWWRLRTHLVHLALLDEAVPLDPEVVGSIRVLTGEPAVAGDADRLASLHLELGLLDHRLGNDKAANASFLAAAQASALEYELTGAMGKRTRFQVEAHSQLVLVATSRRREGDNAIDIDGDGGDDAARAKAVPETLPLNDDTLLEETLFTSTASTSRLAAVDPSAQPPLHPLDQALLISLCLAQANNSPSHGLTASQMMPFLTRVLAHPRNWSVHTTALLLRSRLESTRSRTVERSALQLAALIEQMPTADSAPAERLRFFHQLPLPSKWEMERELAKRYLSLGVVRSALDIFTRLEMWEDAVACLQRMEREDEAERIVRDLLHGRKLESDFVPALARASGARREKLTAAREAKLWCVLGDLALGSDDAARDPAAARARAIELYEKAWVTSAGTSSRAVRSIGSLRVSGQEYEQAIDVFRKSLEINPLYARAWFTLGVCLVKLERWTEARDAFRRDVAVDGEDSEGWNNLAAVYLRLGEEGLAPDEAPPPVTFENKTLAFRALRSGLRTAYNNWRMWQNYMVVAVDVGELSEAARAMKRVVDEVAARDPVMGVDTGVLDRLVDAVMRDDWNGGAGPYDGKPPPTSNEGFGLWPIVERLFADILAVVSDSPRVWKAHARLARWKEDWPAAMEDYMRAYRCSVASDERVERDEECWKDAVTEIEELVDVLSVLGPKVGGDKKKGDWRFQARGIVRTFMGRTRQAFEDRPEWERLQALLDDLKRTALRAPDDHVPAIAGTPFLLEKAAQQDLLSQDRILRLAEQSYVQVRIEAGTSAFAYVDRARPGILCV